MRIILSAMVLMGMIFLTSCQKDATLSNLKVDDDLQVAMDEVLAMSALPSQDFSAVLLDRGPHGHFGHHHHGGNDSIVHPHGIVGDSIGFGDLPQAAQDYITTNNGGSDSVAFVVKITTPDSTIIYGVRLKNGHHLFFDASGNLIVTQHQGCNFTTVTFDQLPAAVQAYLSANIDVTTIVAIIQITKPDGTVIYGVRTDTDQHIFLDANGNVLPPPPHHPHHH